jgi:hypothetical protein
MKVQGLRLCLGFVASLILVACGGGGGSSPQPPAGPQPQTISFAQAGPLNVALGSTTNNVASGGAGSGAITYVSSDPSVATIDANGAAVALGIGSTVITATKAASAAHQQAQATYTLNVQTIDTVSAWIGATNSLVSLPLAANGKQFGRARVADCEITDTVATCDVAESTPVNGATPVTDSRATLTTPAYFAVVNGATIGTPVVANSKRFSGRFGHGAVYFNNRYWVIGGAEVVGPGTPAQFRQLADVWSSTDGRSWKQEVAVAPFTPRWFHQAVVYNNEMWVISGSQGQLALNDAWSSVDGVNWTQRSTSLGLPSLSIFLNVAVFNGALWAVAGDRSYVWNGTTFAPASPATFGAQRANATLTNFNGRLWYIAGAPGYAAGTTGSGANDAWSSTDGVTWVNSTAPFAGRFQHTAFVRNQRLWVMGGRPVTNGVISGQSADAWSTDGTSWTQEDTGYLARGYYMKATENTSGPPVLIGGIVRGYSHHVWQASNAADWTALSANAQFSARHTSAVAFNGFLWLIGGATPNLRDAVGGTTNEIWRSADGVNWSKVATSGTIFSSRDGHRVIVFNNRLWVIGGWDDYVGVGGTETRFNDVWSSADGVTWSRHADAGFSPRVAHDIAVFNNRLWIVGGNVGANTGSNEVWSSTNGDNWTRDTASAAFSPRFSHRVLAFNNALWVIAGTGTGGSAQQDVWRSSDGVNWTLAQGAAFPARARHAAAVLNNRMYVVGGASDESFEATRYNDVWSSADGITWTQDIASAPFAARGLHALVARNNELWLIGGLGWSLLDDVWRSSDGVNWRVAFTHPIASP